MWAGQEGQVGVAALGLHWGWARVHITVVACSLHIYIKNPLASEVTDGKGASQWEGSQAGAAASVARIPRAGLELQASMDHLGGRASALPHAADGHILPSLAACSLSFPQVLLHSGAHGARRRELSQPSLCCPPSGRVGWDRSGPRAWGSRKEAEQDGPVLLPGQGSARTSVEQAVGPRHRTCRHWQALSPGQAFPGLPFSR
jgi:hypothetical protein